MLLRTKLFGKIFEFADIRELMGKANEEKSGDRLAGLAASSTVERAAAKIVLGHVPLLVLRENPAVGYDQDEVTRVIEDGLDNDAFEQIKSWTVGELRDFILDDKTDGENILNLSGGLTAEMVAAVTKLMSNMDLVHAARKIRVIRHCTNTIGLEGTLSSRLQPNHPTDSPEGIRASIYEGLSYGVGDAVIGINPADDSYNSVARLLDMSYEIIQQHKIPTQTCVLAHITTQIRCLEKGSPIGLLFQSISGSQKGNEAFGISVGLLDEAHALAKKNCYPAGPNFMYFETGQGSALSAEAHNGWDQLTLEARNYGLARRYEPFMVNTVVGFIGPEYLYDTDQIHRAGLEDHFMGKLSGISMGCDVCYTNHAKTDQNASENLAILLTAAGCNFFMGVPMADDSMLAYQSTSFHDIATLRSTFHLHAAPEFTEWLEGFGITHQNRFTSLAGDATIFLDKVVR